MATGLTSAEARLDGSETEFGENRIGLLCIAFVTPQNVINCHYRTQGTRELPREFLNCLAISYQLSAISLSSYSVGRGKGVGRGLGVGVGLGVGAQYLPPVFRLFGPSGVPPQTIISLPVQTAVCWNLAEGALMMLVAVQLSVLGLYLPPVFKGTRF